MIPAVVQSKLKGRNWLTPESAFLLLGGNAATASKGALTESALQLEAFGYEQRHDGALVRSRLWPNEIAAD